MASMHFHITVLFGRVESAHTGFVFLHLVTEGCQQSVGEQDIATDADLRLNRGILVDVAPLSLGHQRQETCDVLAGLYGLRIRAGCNRSR